MNDKNEKNGESNAPNDTKETTTVEQTAAQTEQNKSQSSKPTKATKTTKTTKTAKPTSSKSGKSVESVESEPTEEEITQALNDLVEAKKPKSPKHRDTPGDLAGASKGTKSEDVSRILGNCLRLYRMPKVRSVDELRERIGSFFVACMERGEIPTIEKLALSTGYCYNALWEWENGKAVSELGAEAGEVVKKAREFLSAFESELVTEGKVNPVVYIFRAKNYFGLKDQQDYVVTPNNPLGDSENPATIAEKYRDAMPDTDYVESTVEYPSD